MVLVMAATAAPIIGSVQQAGSWLFVLVLAKLAKFAHILLGNPAGQPQSLATFGI